MLGVSDEVVTEVTTTDLRAGSPKTHINKNNTHEEDLSQVLLMMIF